MTPEEVQEEREQKRKILVLESKVAHLEKVAGVWQATPEEWAALTDEEKQALSLDQMATLTTAQWRTLPVEKRKELTVEEWGKLTPLQQGNVFPEDWRSITDSQWLGLPAEQRDDISRDQFLRLAPEQRVNLTLEQWSNLALGQRSFFFSSAATTSEQVASEQKGNPKMSLRKMTGESGPTAPYDKAAVKAEVERLGTLTTGDLKAYAQEKGIEVPSGGTKADLLAAVVKAVKKKAKNHPASGPTGATAPTGNTGATAPTGNTDFSDQS